jgi:hypothetical protein
MQRLLTTKGDQESIDRQLTKTKSLEAGTSNNTHHLPQAPDCDA